MSPLKDLTGHPHDVGGVLFRVKEPTHRLEHREAHSASETESR